MGLLDAVLPELQVEDGMGWDGVDEQGGEECSRMKRWRLKSKAQ
jgi:hypothetical protein